MRAPEGWRTEGLLVILLLALGSLGIADPLIYRPPKEARLPVEGLSPSAGAVGDFNEDGLPDLVVAYLRCDSQKPQLDPRGCPAESEEKNGRIVLFLSEGRTVWRPSQRFVVGEFPQALVAADFTNDGHVDVVVANFGSGSKGSLSIFLGDGTGGLRSRPSFSLDAKPKDMATGDFNKDNKLDLVVTFINTRRVAILLGDGKGDFSYPDEYQVGNAPQAVAVGDFNNDGYLDATTANLSQTQSISILLNDQRGGFGAFTAARHIAVNDSPFDIVTADLNRDGFLDLATSHTAASDSIMVWLGDGQGNFKLHGAFSAGSDPLALAAPDVNGDGFIDIVATNGGSNTITLLFGDGQGRLDGLVFVVTNSTMRIGPGRDEPMGQLLDRLTLRAGASPIAVVDAQLSADRFPDLIVVNQGSHDLSIFLSRSP